jgi:hypothetical protein
MWLSNSGDDQIKVPHGFLEWRTPLTGGDTVTLETYRHTCGGSADQLLLCASVIEWVMASIQRSSSVYRQALVTPLREAVSARIEAKGHATLFRYCYQSSCVVIQLTSVVVRIVKDGQTSLIYPVRGLMMLIPPCLFKRRPLLLKLISLI